MIPLLILIPLLSAILVAAGPRSAATRLGLFLSVATGLFGAWLCTQPGPGGWTLSWEYNEPWIKTLNIDLHFAMDGLSRLLVLLTSIVVPFGIFAGRDKDRAHTALMLVVQSALYGTFTAQDFVLWFLFWELSLIPAFLLIRIWGGEGRDRAATKFFLYTFLGSAAMLVAFLAIYPVTKSFAFETLAEQGSQNLIFAGLVTKYGASMAWAILIGVFLGFAVKVPIFPFHTWLPDAYAEAPAGVTMVLTGTLSKMGAYGIIRLFLPLFPAQIQAAAPCLLGLALASIVFSSLAACAQTDIKRLFAYLSINHLGYCMLAVFATAAAWTPSTPALSTAWGGAMLQIFNHGITAAALFFLAGWLERQSGTRDIRELGGLMQRIPRFTGWAMVAMFASLGLPGLNGFVGEFLIFRGVFALVPWAAAIGLIGLLFTAIALLRCIKAIASGPESTRASGLREIWGADRIALISACLFMVLLGVAPQLLLNLCNATVNAFLTLASR